jgi:hypothetical protein
LETVQRSENEEEIRQWKSVSKEYIGICAKEQNNYSKAMKLNVYVI